MHTRSRYGVLAALLLGSAALSAGCDQTSTPGTMSQKIESGADKIAGATDRATVKAAAAVDDTAITAKVKSAVLAEPGLKSLQIDVDTKDAVVTLRGTVDNDALKSRATQVAQNVNGVRSVVDNLEVKPSQSG